MASSPTTTWTRAIGRSTSTENMQPQAWILPKLRKAEKTECKKTVIVIDEQGNKLESTYPKRAKGLIKNGRARVVDENTICLVDLPKNIILEENKMNNNNINLQENKEVKIDLAYIMNKIDEINRMNLDLINKQDFGEMSNVPGTKNPVQCICETNNKMIDFLQDIYKSLQSE